MQFKVIFLAGVVSCVLCCVTSVAQPPITALAFAPGGESVLAASQSGVKQLAWPSLQLQRTIETQGVNLHDLAFSPNGKMLAIAGGAPGDNGSVEVLSWPELERTKMLDEHDDSVTSVAWHGDGVLVTASLDHTVKIWDVSTGKPTHTLRGHSRGVTSVCIAGSGKNLVSAGIDQNLRVWNVDTAELVRSLSNHTKRVTALAPRPGDHGLPMIASASEDRTVRFWQPTIGRLVRFIRLDAAPLAIEWTPGGERITASCDDGCVYVIDPDSVTVENTIKVFNDWAYSLTLHPSDRSAAIGSADGSVHRTEF